MDTENSFKLSVDFEGRHFEGTVTPSVERGDYGVPIFFRFVLGDILFSYILPGYRVEGERRRRKGARFANLAINQVVLRVLDCCNRY